LLGVQVSVGQVVKTGDSIGPVGDNPKDGDARHLHFELSPVSHYAPVNPEPFLLPGAV
jgi:murein DD-endopeptidase MepM/ murein hydrolase activator NlpD